MSRRRCGLAAVAIMLTTLAGSSARPEPASPRPDLRERVTDRLLIVERPELYQTSDSSQLAWGESYLLSAYLAMWEATGDTRWLDRMVRDASAIFANLSSGEGRHPGWRTARYSVGLAEAKADSGNPSTAELTPATQRVYDMAAAAQVTGHVYRVRVGPECAMDVTDTTDGKQLATRALAPDRRITDIPGLTFTVTGSPQPGDVFTIKTQAAKPMEYVVHDGMILTPIAGFCAAALTDDALKRTYGRMARRYLDCIERQLLPKWEPCWRELPGGMGVYVAQDDPAHRTPGATLPHNQYLALARVYIALYRITGKHEYRERVESMGRFFRSKLRLVGGHYEWNYWDRAGAWDDAGGMVANVEDTSHAQIDMGFAVEAYDAGLVFDRRDMVRFARTVRDAMWNGSETQPRVGAHVNATGDRVQVLNWAGLGRFSRQVRAIETGMITQLTELSRTEAAGAAQLLALERAGWSPRPARATTP